jgi:hypothetical protein
LKNLKIQTGTGSNRPVSIRFFNRKTGKPVLFFWAFLGFFGLFNGFSDGLVINVNII